MVETTGPFILESMNTLRAPRWRIWMARVFGKKIIGRDGRFEVTIAKWRGKMYLISYRDDVQGGER